MSDSIGEPAAASPVRMTVNGVTVEREVAPRTLLVDFLRRDLGLTGTHVGCDTSVCGACTVLVDGRSAKACTLFAWQAQDSSVTTVEGLAAADGSLHPLQAAFNEKHALHCGYCTPGMLMSAMDLLGREPAPSEGDVRRAISGNVCRCTGYQNIVEAILHAAAQPAAGNSSS